MNSVSKLKTAPLKLTPEELSILTMIRRNSFQEIVIQLQDSVITSVDQTLKFRRKKGGGLVTGNVNRVGNVNRAPSLSSTKLSAEEISAVNMIREKAFQKVTINVKNGIDSIYQTVKYRKAK